MVLSNIAILSSGISEPQQDQVNTFSPNEIFTYF